MSIARGQGPRGQECPGHTGAGLSGVPPGPLEGRRGNKWRGVVRTAVQGYVLVFDFLLRKLRRLSIITTP